MKRFTKPLLILLILLLALSPCALAEFAARVTAPRLSVYADKDMTEKLGSLKKGTIVTVASHADGVAQVSYMGRSGYASADELQAISSDSQEATITRKVRVYQNARTSSRSRLLKKGTQVNLLMSSGSWAMVEKGGYIGFMNKKYVKVNEPVVTPTPTPAPTPMPTGIAYGSFEAVVVAERLPVYASADIGSAQLGVLKQGARVTVVAYNDLWACLRSDNAYGFALRSGLQKASEAAPTATAEPTPAPTPVPTPTPAPTSSAQTFEEAVKSGKYSNEELIFLFLTRHMKLNTAAACGILSNIYSESNFLPTVYYGGAYGICQWLGGRLSKMKDFCAEKGYDYTALPGQLYFLEHELTETFPKVLAHMQGVENTAEGAYDAGYYWCYYYEIPASKASASVKRGDRARDVYWAKYNK